MQKQIIKTVEVRAGVNSKYLESTLTTDITVLESIFDLIDNSIDAARDHLISQGFECDEYGLPKSYEGYKINIRLGEKSISVLDNCLGLDEETLSQRAFQTAEASNHKYGIGHYGLGLKRALLKFGRKFAFSSDNGDIAFKMNFDGNMISGGEKMLANGYTTTGHRKALFVVSDIKPEIQYEIQSQSWFENATKLLKIRYSLYTDKGLKIGISSSSLRDFVRADGSLPTIRTDSKLKPIKKFIDIDGVSVHINSGVHGKYYFPIEGSKYSLSTNKTLTDAFGLYFVCNDRVIVSSSTASEHGWKTKWHSEYNGFVCVVRFISEDPQKIPWNTLKTALRTDGKLFVQVRDELQPIADLYRQSVKKLYPPKNTNIAAPDAVVGVKSVNEKTGGTGKASGGKGSKDLPSAGKNKQLHPNNWATLLPTEFPHSADEVLNAFIIDAINLICDDAPCAGAMLLRATLERSLRQLIQKSGSFESVKLHFYSSSEGRKKNHSDEQKKAQGLDLSMMLAWISDEKIAFSIFGTEEKPRLWLASKKAKEHTKKLNGIIHGLELIDSNQVKIIRNEIYPLLRFCVERSVSRA